MRLAVYNPLPAALAHYTLGVSQILTRLGVEHDLVVSGSIEVGSSGGRSLASRAAQAMAERKPLRGRDVLAVWPAFADLDPAVWALAGPRSATLIWHDPVPIRRTHGSHRWARVVGQRAQRLTGLRVAVHSEAARVDLQERGWRVATSVAHPFVDRPVPVVDRSPVALVAGQFKPERDLSTLRALAPRLAAAGLVPRIVGAGWPEIPGWQLESRFLDEAELDEELASAAVVLLPYQRVYQSGIAVRAAETGTPVVGRADTNLVELFGVDWPGLVDPAVPDVAAWEEAVARTTAVTPADTAERIGRWKHAVTASWEAFVHGEGWLPSPVVETNRIPGRPA